MVAVSKLKAVILAVSFCVFFTLAYGAFRLLPLWGNKVGEQVARVTPPKEKKDPAAHIEDLGGRGTTRDLSKIVGSYRKQDELPKAAVDSAASLGETSGGAVVRAGVAAPVRTPPPTLKLIREWPTGKKWIALTFDDGPHPEYTPQMLQLLAEKHVRATFFLLGPNVEKNPTIVKEIVDAGHEVGNHSWSHPILSKLQPAKIREELEKTTAAIKEAAGVQVRLMRPPYGSANKKVQDTCDELGLKIICWSIDTDDWRKTTTKEKMVDLIKKGAHDGAIILMHDRHEKALETTREVIDYLRGQGYEFVTVGELLGLGPMPKTAPTASQAASSPESLSVAPRDVASAAASPSLPAPTGSDLRRLTVPEVSTPSTSTQELPPVSPEKITKAPLPAPRNAR